MSKSAVCFYQLWKELATASDIYNYQNKYSIHQYTKAPSWKNAKFAYGYGITFSHPRRITGTIGNLLVRGNDATMPFSSVGLRTDEFILNNSFSQRMQLHTPTTFSVADRIS